jgi:GTP pyrophosphokinase
LHTKVWGPGHGPLEIQIRTKEMHRDAEYGIAAHWKYKERRDKSTPLDEQLQWFHDLHELLTNEPNANASITAVKRDLLDDQVFVFTPKGDVFELPAGSTPIDFAYRIHSAVGSACVGAKVDGRIVPLSYRFQNGDICEILTSRNARGPNLDWLEFVHTRQARNRIRSFLRKQAFDANVREGQNRLERAAKAAHMDPRSIIRDELLEKVAHQHNARTADELRAVIGWGDVSAGSVFEKLRHELAKITRAPEEVLPPIRKKKSTAHTNGQGSLAVGLSAEGVGDVLFTIARCCAPISGDAIQGYITRGRGVTIHRQDCRNLMAYRQREPDRIMNVQWQFCEGVTYRAEIQAVAIDRVGLLNEITGVISERKLNIENVSLDLDSDRRARMNFVLAVPNLEAVNRVMEDLRRLPEVIRVHRVANGGR